LLNQLVSETGKVALANKYNWFDRQGLDAARRYNEWIKDDKIREIAREKEATAAAEKRALGGGMSPTGSANDGNTGKLSLLRNGFEILIHRWNHV
jgi:hypothetical protein